MSTMATAEIIPFPFTVRAPDGPTVEVTPPDVAGIERGDTAVVTPDIDAEAAQGRLARALRSLEAALAEQRTAVARWRGALSELRTTVQGLSDSVQTYRGTLASLDGKVSSLRGEAARLERWADDALETASNGDTAKGQASAGSAG